MADAESITRLNAALEGRYRIERELGAGGMATVYLAEDVRHRRSVALKVLKPELAAVVGADRFLAEIETTANLQHPHILPLFDSGEADGFLFYVMPYLEGESLRDRLDREHQLPVDEAVEIASKVAGALDYAHRHGVIHRDIKPANILLHDGEPVVADFGIALAVSAGGGDRLTETGLSLGTPHYMSPEQATGDLNVGPPSDLWGLGCVLYEMLVGEPPFTGGTPQVVLGKIITGDVPHASADRASVSPNLDAAIAKALEKVPADRFRDAGEFRTALDNPQFRVDIEAAASSNRSLFGMATLLAIGALAGFLGTRFLTKPVVEPPNSMTVLRTTGLAPNHAPLGDFLLGPRSAGFVYEGDDNQFWYRDWDQFDPRPIRPFTLNNWLSPDGQEISVLTGGALHIVPLDGGPSRHIADSVSYNPLWHEDGYFYFARSDGTIHRVSSDGGEVQPLGIELRDGEIRHHRFQTLAGRDKAVFAAFVEGGGCRIWGIDLETRERKLLAEGSDPRLTPTGHLLFGDAGGRLMAAALDADELELGPPRPVGPRLRRFNPCALAYSLSPDGSLGYWDRGQAGTHEMVWVDRRGVAAPVDPGWRFDPGRAGARGWSSAPDGSKLAIRLMDDRGNHDIWVKELPSGPLGRVTFTDGVEFDPSWLSPDSLLFLYDYDSPPAAVMGHRADGRGEPEVVYADERDIVQAIPSQSGEWVVLRTAGPPANRGGADILGLRRGGSPRTIPLAADPEHRELNPSLSPDGRWLAYVTDESGSFEIVVRPFPNVDDGRWQLSLDGGLSPLWSADGGEIFYITPPPAPVMMVAQIQADSSFRVSGRESLFPVEEMVIRTHRPSFDVGSDGRFLMMRAVQPSFVLIQNWFDELRRLVPH